MLNGVSRVSRHYFEAFASGGDDGNRTHDPLLAGQVLSQLSYTPIWGLAVLQNRTTAEIILISSILGLSI